MDGNSLNDVRRVHIASEEAADYLSRCIEKASPYREAFFFCCRSSTQEPIGPKSRRAASQSSSVARLRESHTRRYGHDRRRLDTQISVQDPHVQLLARHARQIRIQCDGAAFLEDIDHGRETRARFTGVPAVAVRGGYTSCAGTLNSVLPQPSERKPQPWRATPPVETNPLGRSFIGVSQNGHRKDPKSSGSSHRRVWPLTPWANALAAAARSFAARNDDCSLRYPTTTPKAPQ